MVDVDHPRLSTVRQCEIVRISRSSFYYQPKGESEENLELMRRIDEQFLDTPWYGSRQMARYLRRQGYHVCRKRVPSDGTCSDLSGTSLVETTS